MIDQPVSFYMSHMKKPVFFICENKAQIEADQRLCFCYTDSTIPPLPRCEIQPLAILCGCTVWFVSDWSEIPKTGVFTTRLILEGICHTILFFQVDEHMTMSDFYLITLLVTSEQESAIVDLYTQRCWVYMKLNAGEKLAVY